MDPTGLTLGLTVLCTLLCTSKGLSSPLTPYALACPKPSQFGSFVVKTIQFHTEGTFWMSRLTVRSDALQVVPLAPQPRHSLGLWPATWLCCLHFFKHCFQLTHRTPTLQASQTCPAS